MSTMQHALALGLFAVLALCLTACNKYTEMQDGKTVSVRQGDTFEVQLDANPSTGYRWKLVDLDTSVLQTVGTPQYSPQKTGLMGSGGTETYEFEAVGQGVTTLRMHYVRPWERDQNPAETYTLTVEVE